ncbi:maleylacetoacetate isomerase [Thalassobius sp. S69A]|uniref:maleylacetoacetate isomerase n=1 Tax=unclassified Thalassovita TaxID=2619711 RepID=UPI000C0C7565|nr:maleylacetoacetate isomerase [Paracoccaceae bacterium]MBT24946.1 maleylacetoacetate isomerase [Paracoccaceae bacterium]
MRFLGYFRSSSAYRCRIAFNLKGLDYDFESIHLKSGDHKTPQFAAVNPQKLVPALITDDGQELYQSLAIIEWLDETYGGARLIPADKDLRAQVRAFAQVIACEIHPLQNLRVLQYLRNDLAQDEDAVNAWLARWLGDGLQACEDILQKHPEAAYCFGDEPTLADICLVPQVFSAERFNVDISHLSRINAIYKQCQSNRAFAAAHPKEQPDFET